MMPLTKSSMVALGIFTALFGFKDLMWPLIANTEQNSMPLAAALAKLQGQFAVKFSGIDGSIYDRMYTYDCVI